ncbi:nuclear rim protein Amo1 [Schizosaccharomyces cryophilus OY26]|uniref:Nuclear rim protein Amo1 n=1 Tax=Schizosaccharomyces cryophilus (strain OY26 / ATCC MYA-4695 / CBS 11777 / NBRC 106824 / NRRL Y48691) TaxID=653667 RepID=S9XJS4_SCHCR|nr:nuclear rim protein Amo1 [Schizosaccharomyces cryophilus OY26]EPY53956.1 nuclear rim protein Amo1 [Schizosaccharomyces cryophilus OY26]
MAVCKFFLENRCRNGTNCRFEHVYPHLKPGSNSYIFRAENAAPPKWAESKHWKKAELDRYFPVSRTVGFISTNLQAEKPSWPLTGYALKEFFPSLYNGDVSPEELRWWFYQARALNAIPQYEQRQTELMNDINNKQKIVLTNREGAVNEMRNRLVGKTGVKSIFDTTPTNSFSSNTNASFGAFPKENKSQFPSSAPAFGFQQNQPASSGFGGITATPTTSAFGSQLGSSPFASSNNTPAAPTSFSGGGFSQNAPTHPQFGVSGFANQPPSSFGGFSGNQQPAFAQSLFGQSNPFQGQANSSMDAPKAFEQPKNPVNPSPFGIPSAPVFGQTAFQQPANPALQNSQVQNNAPSGFQNLTQNQTPASVFGSFQNPNAAPSGFGMGQNQPFGFSQPVTGQAQGATTNIMNKPEGSSGFGFQQQPPASSFAPVSSNTSEPTKINAEVSVISSDFPPEFIQQFQAPEFTLGKIPTVPPPLEFC